MLLSRPHPRRARWQPHAAAALAGAALLVCAGSARGQGAGAAAVQVTARDAETRDPVVGAAVVIGGAPRGLTDERGALRVQGLGPGSYPVRITHLGYHAYAGQVTVSEGAGAEHAVTLVPRAVQLAEVSVRERGRARSRVLNRFYARSETGGGSYFTREQIDAIGPRNVTDLFRLMPGLVVAQMPGGEGRARVHGDAMRVEAGRMGQRGPVNECPILYFIDGTPIQVMPGGSIDHEIRPSEVEGIEVYRRGTQAPPEFRRPGANCGIVLIWKRERIDAG